MDAPNEGRIQYKVLKTSSLTITVTLTTSHVKENRARFIFFVYFIEGGVFKQWTFGSTTMTQKRRLK